MKITRRNFIDAAALTTGAVALGELMRSGLAAGDASEWKVLDWQNRDLPDGNQFEGSLEIDGRVIRMFTRRVDTPNSYVVFARMVLPNGKSTTTIINGRKGEVEGDYRTDAVEVSNLLDDGTVKHSNRQSVKVLITHPYQGLSSQQTVDAFIQDEQSGRFN